MLVLAGPGSGKTAVITGRVCRLIQKGISPSSILVATFTRAAAAEMKGRFLNTMGLSASPVTFGTFHGIFYGILRQAYRIDGRNILGDDQRLRLLGEIIDACCGGGEREADLPSAVGREISAVKENRMELSNFYSAALPEEDFRKVYREYGKWMRDNRKLDFDDIGVWCWRLFTERPEILRRWQQKFRYLLVDEFQDINPIQYRLMKAWNEGGRELFVIGDPDQSIYGFRGSDAACFAKLSEDYPDLEIIELRENYRSSAPILNAALAVISENPGKERKLNAAKSEEEPAPVRIVKAAATKGRPFLRPKRSIA